MIRVVRFELPDPGQLKLPDVIMGISKLTRGMVLVTGSAGSGKSTTLACIIDEINKTRNAHVITLEDPIEYLHRHKKAWLPSVRLQRIRTVMFPDCVLPCGRHRM